MDHISGKVIQGFGKIVQGHMYRKI